VFGSPQSASIQNHVHGIGSATAYSSGQAAGNATNMGSAQNTAHNRFTESSGGAVNETRPRNVALLACIRF
jgi:hypothetical protein